MNGTTRMVALACAAVIAAAGSAAAGGSALDRLPGYVDGAGFVELAGDDGVTVEVNLNGALLRAITRVDEDLARLAGGLESIHAVVLDLEAGRDPAAVRRRVDELERSLRRDGWERLATVRERGGRVHVLVLSEGERIRGLTVLALDGGELVFANIAGEIDLAAIAELGREMDLPGLDALGDR